MNKPELIQDIEKKLNKEQVKNSLTETVSGNALDASQGKVLNDKINVLESDRGYLKSPILTQDTDFNTVTNNGKYVFSTNLNSPIVGVRVTYSVDVTSHHNASDELQRCVQTATAINQTYLTYIRIYTSGAWGDWQQIATANELEELKIQKITSGTHTLSNYKKQGIYCFSTSTTITDIPVGSNGWLIVLPSTSTTQVKQIWLRWGTVNANDYMTYSRLIVGDTIGDWTQYATTVKTKF